MQTQTAEREDEVSEVREEEITPLERLSRFVGAWQGQGSSYGPAGGPPQETMAMDTFEWLEGEFFLLHRWKWDISGSTFEGIEVLGWDEEKNEYFSNMYDNAGHQVRYHLEEKDGVWLYEGEFQKGEIKVTENKISSYWRASEDGKTWTPLCDIQWDKVTQ